MRDGLRATRCHTNLPLQAQLAAGYFFLPPSGVVTSKQEILVLFVFLVGTQITPASEYKLKWSDPDDAGLVKFLVEDKG